MKIGWRQQEDGPGRERIRRAVESMLPFRRPHNSARKIHASAVGFSPDERREILEQARGAVIGTLHWLAWEAAWFPLETLLFAFNSH